MEPKVSDLMKLQANRKDFDVTSIGSSLTDIFAERKGYINEMNFYLAYFNVIPNVISEIRIDCKKANSWFAEANKSAIKDVYFIKRYFDRNKEAEYDDIFYFIYEDLIIDFDTNSSVVRFLFRETDYNKVEKVITQIKKFRIKQKRRKPKLSLLVYSKSGIETKSFAITKPKLDISNNYNEDFKEIHNTIIKRLSQKNSKGLVLLHGKPGTGKTSYIRYLISSIKKDVIFLPPNMASAITNPDLISVLIDNPNSIFVIEDAENIVVDREKDGYSPVSPLLNISDGLLSDCLNIQVICSFNTDISKVDTALLRKGRLIAKYEFKELELPKAQALSEKLGFNSQLSCPMTLTAIYNQEEKDFQQKKERTAIGFKATA